MGELFNVKDPNGAVELPDGICLMAYRGSIAHNMFVPKNDPNSIDDVDLMGVVLAPEDCYLGLKEWGSRGTKEIKRGVHDIVYYEIRKAVSLLLQGNPNIMGLLWTRVEHILIHNWAGQLLLDNRGLFVGKHAYNAFAGYAHAQMEKMETRDPAELREYVAVTAELKARGLHPNHKGEHIAAPADHPPEYAAWGADALIQRLRSFQKKGENIGYMGDKRKHLVLEHGYDAKNAAHLIRLLRMCIEFMETGEMQVYREADRDELLAIKRGQWPLSQVKELANSLFEQAREAKNKSALPNEPDRDGVERLLVEILRRHLNEGKL